MPAPTSRRQAPRAASVSSRGWLACSTTNTAFSDASASTKSGVTRCGSTIGTRLWKRMTPRCGMASSAAMISVSRRGAIINGSPPVTMTSQISGPLADIVERCLQLRRRQRLAARSHDLAAEAEAAIDRADMDRLQEHAVGIAMHDPLHRRMAIVADRIARSLRPDLELGAARHELRGDRVRRDRSDRSAPPSPR